MVPRNCSLYINKVDAMRSHYVNFFRSGNTHNAFYRAFTFKTFYHYGYFIG